MVKKILRISFTGLWIVVASVLLTRWWLTSPSSAFIPNFPEAFWLWLSKLGGVEGAEGMADLTILVGFILSLIIVSLLTLLGLFLWRRANKSFQRTR